MSDTTSGCGPAPAPRAHGAPELSVVIPAYNEERRLGSTLDRVGRYLRASALEWELIVVDDGSTDGTAGLVRTASSGDRRIRLVRSRANRGKGHAVRTGVLVSRGRQVLFSDADLSTPIEDLAPLRAALRAGADCAIGSRAHNASDVLREQNAVRRVLGQAGNRLVRALATPGIADTQCGFKLFDGAKARRAFGLAVIDGWGFDVEILYLFARFGWTVEEMPVRWAHRPGSKLRPSAYLRVLYDLGRLRHEHGRRSAASPARRSGLADARARIFTGPPAPPPPSAAPAAGAVPAGESR
ncbi:dolichyl-phosphate beta-glucosyltransferase [Actinomadura algeriensis]|uniref:dolichyl-phosphate beta-glucosyltransferase n=1 Tax=Actinomadura algeriensis TaxID=1679523 RepID=A0ABR9JJC4_9ACTN|nr:dolichyl-phosphate beta-glucosyltransferase [Actinomadura algeriensis]MBE1530491.1 glycosyltransferase involved in cell wall biosynthesis [Actinomadura algeriensis]